MITLDARQRADQFRITDHETDAPAGHVVAFRQGEELHRNVFRPRHLHDRRRFPAVIDDIGIGQIVDHQHVVLLGQRHHPLEEIQLHALRSRVGREAEDHHFRTRDGFPNGALQLTEEIHAVHQRHRTHGRRRSPRRKCGSGSWGSAPARYRRDRGSPASDAPAPLSNRW